MTDNEMSCVFICMKLIFSGQMEFLLKNSYPVGIKSSLNAECRFQVKTVGRWVLKTN